MYPPSKRSRDQTPDPGYFSRLIDETEAAEYLGFTVRALQNWRVRGGGPKYVRVSARSVRYRRKDLDAWAEQRLEASTSEPALAVQHRGYRQAVT